MTLATNASCTLHWTLDVLMTWCPTQTVTCIKFRIGPEDCGNVRKYTTYIWGMLNLKLTYIGWTIRGGPVSEKKNRIRTGRILKTTTHLKKKKKKTYLVQWAGEGMVLNTRTFMWVIVWAMGKVTVNLLIGRCRRRICQEEILIFYQDFNHKGEIIGQINKNCLSGDW